MYLPSFPDIISSPDITKNGIAISGKLCVGENSCWITAKSGRWSEDMMPSVEPRISACDTGKESSSSKAKTAAKMALIRPPGRYPPD